MHVVAPPEIRTPSELAFLAGAFDVSEPLTIDLRPVTWIAPLGVVAVLASCLRAGSATIFPPDAEAPRRYLATIGFLDELTEHGWQSTAGVETPRGATPCLPVTRLDRISEVDQLFDTLSERLVDDVPYPVRDRLSVVLYELSQNAREHGSPCYVIAQAHSGATSGMPGVHAAVGDFGPGFASTLAFLNPGDDARAIRLGFEEGVSRTGDPVRGIGLGWVRGQIDDHRGASIWIASGAGTVHYGEGEFQQWLTGAPLAGTFASVYFPYTPPR